MNKGRKAVAVLGFFVMATVGAPAMAQYSAWYVGGAITHADYKGPRLSDTGWGALFGYEFTPNYALEAGYIDLGTVSESGPGFSASFGATAVELAGIGAFELSDRISMFGRLGVYRGDTKLDVDVDVDDFEPIRERERTTDLVYGIGIHARFGNNLMLRGSWQRYQDVGDFTEVDALGIALFIRF
jgi:OmpA-OmpF porin, OOP family